MEGGERAGLAVGLAVAWVEALDEGGDGVGKGECGCEGDVAS